MGPKTLLYLSTVLCLLNAGRIVLAVTAEPPTLAAEILTPESDRQEGGELHMKCTATNYDFKIYTLEWQKDNITLRRNEETNTSDPRFNFSTMHELNITTELLGI